MHVILRHQTPKPFFSLQNYYRGHPHHYIFLCLTRMNGFIIISSYYFLVADYYDYHYWFAHDIIIQHRNYVYELLNVKTCLFFLHGKNNFLRLFFYEFNSSASPSYKTRVEKHTACRIFFILSHHHHHHHCILLSYLSFGPPIKKTGNNSKKQQ